MMWNLNNTRSYDLIREELEEVADTEGISLPVSRNPRFRANCGQLANQLKEINTATVAL